MSSEFNPEMPCFLCGRTLKVKKTKGNKPYFICDTCGLQAFVRYKAGIHHFQELLVSLDESGEKYLSLNRSSFIVLSLVSRLNELREKLDKVNQNKSLSDYFLSDTESELAINTLKKEIKNVRNALRGRYGGK